MTRSHLPTVGQSRFISWMQEFPSQAHQIRVSALSDASEVRPFVHVAGYGWVRPEWASLDNRPSVIDSMHHPHEPMLTVNRCRLDLNFRSVQVSFEAITADSDAALLTYATRKSDRFRLVELVAGLREIAFEEPRPEPAFAVS